MDTVTVTLELPKLPLGYEYTGDWRCLHEGELLWDGSEWYACGSLGTTIPCPVLRKVETFTERVNRSGWPWPFGPEVGHVAMDENGRWFAFLDEPEPASDRWECTSYANCDYLKMPSAEGFNWKQTLLCREDFI